MAKSPIKENGWSRMSKSKREATIEATKALYSSNPSVTPPAPSTLPKRKKYIPKPIDPLNPPERHEQTVVVAYCTKLNVPVFAIPNDAKRTLWAAIQAKKTGLMPGIPDLMVPIAKGDYHGLFIEMKRKLGTQANVTSNQAYWLKKLADNGYKTLVAFGAEQAIAAIEGYLAQK